MTVHVCRDLVLGNNGAATGSYDTMWALMVFMQGVLGYTPESQRGNLVPPTNGDTTITYFTYSGGSTFTPYSSSIISLHSASCYITSSGPHTLVQFSTDTVNLLSAAYPVNWPSGSGAWPGPESFGSFGPGGGDPFYGSWIAIKSLNNPRVNSGIFQIINSTLWLSGNAVEIDYRTTSPTVQETTSQLTASIWLPPPGSDIASLPASRGIFRTGDWPFDGATPAWASNGNTGGYQGNGNSTYPRAVLTSPHSTAYQVRVAIETPNDVGFNGAAQALPVLTAIPGFSGSSGDFQSGSYAADEAVYHIHIPQWINYSLANAFGYAGSLPALDYFRNTNDTVHSPIRYRFYAWGDDTTGTCLVLIRNANGAQDAYYVFGVPEDETQPLPPLPVQRLFCHGCQLAGLSIDWIAGTRNSDGYGGSAYSLTRWQGPISALACSYVYAAGAQSNGNGIRFDGTAGDTPFLEGSELIPVDIIAGTADTLAQWGGAPANLFPIEPRRMGRFPFARQGRSTGMSSWTTDSSMMWFHASNGFYVPWGGIVAL